jgi:hypothetical protein
LGNHRIVQQVAPQLDDSALVSYFELTDPGASITMRTNSSAAHLYAIEKGAGIGVLPTFATALGAPIVPLDIGGRHALDIRMTYHPQVRLQPHKSLVIDWLRRIFDPQLYPCFGDGFIHPNALCQILQERSPIHSAQGCVAAMPAGGERSLYRISSASVDPIMNEKADDIPPR